MSKKLIRKLRRGEPLTDYQREHLADRLVRLEKREADLTRQRDEARETIAEACGKLSIMTSGATDSTNLIPLVDLARARIDEAREELAIQRQANHELTNTLLDMKKQRDAVVEAARGALGLLRLMRDRIGWKAFWLHDGREHALNVENEHRARDTITELRAALEEVDGE